MKNGSVATFRAILAVCLSGWPSSGAETTTFSAQPAETRTPIKHLIVVVGENRSFDNVFATYVSPNPRQVVWNLLSQGIIDRTGQPGPKAARALQLQGTDTTSYQLSPQQTGEFPLLPQPGDPLPRERNRLDQAAL